MSQPPADSVPPTGERGRRGHIGLIVLGSILAGLALGLVLVLGVFGGSEEATITGAALMDIVRSDGTTDPHLYAHRVQGIVIDPSQRYSVAAPVERTTNSPSPTRGLSVYDAHFPSGDSVGEAIVCQRSQSLCVMGRFC